LGEIPPKVSAIGPFWAITPLWTEFNRNIQMQNLLTDGMKMLGLLKAKWEIAKVGH